MHKYMEKWENASSVQTGNEFSQKNLTPTRPRLLYVKATSEFVLGPLISKAHRIAVIKMISMRV